MDSGNDVIDASERGRKRELLKLAVAGDLSEASFELRLHNRMRKQAETLRDETRWL